MFKGIGLGFEYSYYKRYCIYRNEIAEMMGYKKMDLVAAVALGHPKSRPINRQRKKLEEILIYKK